MRFLLPLLLALSAWAQPDPIWRKLLAVPSTPGKVKSIPETIPGMMFWWKATDISSNTAMTFWKDRIVGSTMLVNAGTITNNIQDVWFPGGNGGQGFNVTNVNIGVDSGAPETNSFFVIFSPKGGAQAQIFDGTADSTGYALHSNNHIFDEASAVDLTKSAISVGVYQDWIQATTNLTTPLFPRMYCFTNGAIAATNTVTGISHLAKVGTQNNGFSGYKGSISEIIIYTNYVFTLNDVSNLHYYRTNLTATSQTNHYGGSP